MGKATPFEGELDYWGNPTCGQSFMAGTICSRPPKHGGSCAAECQNCGGDWMNGTCTCPPHCNECDRELLADAEVEEGYCGYCLAEMETDEPYVSFNHTDYGSREVDWCDEGFTVDDRGAYLCRRPKGHIGGHGCPSADGQRARDLNESGGPTPEELAEVYKSFGVDPPV